MKESVKFAAYRFLFQKNEAHHHDVYITSNGPVFKQAGNLLEQLKADIHKSENCQNGRGKTYEKYLYV